MDVVCYNQNKRQDTSDISISLFEMMSAVSTAIDLVNPTLNNHHKLVCFIGASLAIEEGYDDHDFNIIFISSLLHDIGAIALADRLKLFECENGEVHKHAFLGSTLLASYDVTKPYAEYVKYHHVPWEDGKGERFKRHPVPMISHMIHLADRIAVLIKQDQPIFSQVPNILRIITEKSGQTFVPEYVETFKKLAKKEAFWLDASLPSLDNILMKMSRLSEVNLNLEKLTRLAKFFSRIIDTRSRFTSTHSSGVAASAKELAILMGLCTLDSRKMLVAGYLHDIGKLAVPNKILEKNGAPTEDEWRRIRAHPHFTRRVLEGIKGLEDITDWAANHHETLLSDGYPIHIGSKELSIGSRILAIADIYAALTEARPYREGLNKEKACGIISEMVDEGKLDADVFRVLVENYEKIESSRKQAQQDEVYDLTNFWEVAST